MKVRGTRHAGPQCECEMSRYMSRIQHPLMLPFCTAYHGTQFVAPKASIYSPVFGDVELIMPQMRQVSSLPGPVRASGGMIFGFPQSRTWAGQGGVDVWVGMDEGVSFGLGIRGMPWGSQV
eukprot:1160178-Pelagomonas_calceolata.AAC.19